METEKFPKAYFKGKIIEDLDFTKNGVYQVRSKGVFSIHGTDKEKIVKVKLTVKDKEVSVDTNFEIPLADHDIKIPKVVNQKIASVILVEVKATMRAKN